MVQSYMLREAYDKCKRDGLYPLILSGKKQYESYLKYLIYIMV